MRIEDIERIERRKEQTRKKKELARSKVRKYTQTRTLENMREKDETFLEEEEDQQEIAFNTDEFSHCFSKDMPAKVAIYKSLCKSRKTLQLAIELTGIFHNATIYKPKIPNLPMAEIIKDLKEKNYTDLVVLTEYAKKPYRISFVHFPNGPTANFKISSVRLRKDIPNHGNPTPHPPELFLNNFNTMLGATVGRFLLSMMPRNPKLKGRQLATFHNQRDFIFFRMHRYIFENNNSVRIQELGPRFTLRLISLQTGTLQKNADYYWIRKGKMNTKKSFYF